MIRARAGGFVANLLIRRRGKWQLPQVPQCLDWHTVWHATFGLLSGALLSMFISRSPWEIANRLLSG